MNAKKATIAITDGEGRTLPAGAVPAQATCTTRQRSTPGASPTCSTSTPRWRGSRSTPRVPGTGQGDCRNQVQAPPLKPKKDAPPGRDRHLGRASLAERWIRTDLCIQHHRRPARRAMADPPGALPRTTRALRRDLHRHHQPGLRPRRRAVTHASQPASQHGPVLIAHHVVNCCAGLWPPRLASALCLQLSGDEGRKSLASDRGVTCSACESGLTDWPQTCPDLHCLRCCGALRRVFGTEAPG